MLAPSRSGSGIMQVRAILLAAALVLAPLGARAADLVVWWEGGLFPEEDPAVREIVAAFERKTGKQVELAFQPLFEMPALLAAVVEAGNPPDFVFSEVSDFTRWAYEGCLADL